MPNVAPRYGRGIVGSIRAPFRAWNRGLDLRALPLPGVGHVNRGYKRGYDHHLICRILRYFGGTRDDHGSPCGCE